MKDSLVDTLRLDGEKTADRHSKDLIGNGAWFPAMRRIGEHVANTVSRVVADQIVVQVEEDVVFERRLTKLVAELPRELQIRNDIRGWASKKLNGDPSVPSLGMQIVARRLFQPLYRNIDRMLITAIIEELRMAIEASEHA